MQTMRFQLQFQFHVSLDVIIMYITQSDRVQIEVQYNI